ncbi:DUF4169 family protein [Blastomonas aquatica]|uniref:DUF4169 domain-containing protein n=1 Tax=Blastomonas aquatica TaxID=1510276 RepID=A0ABQ1JI92_9SPHN|nr:DUF4169 family protein [Blastomonas aquatica]GGB69170.1 DUF4169 domain-containing protein [Blastomonas aquatica]
MADIINLRQARKAHKRRQGEALAAANRAKFGQTKSQRTLHSAEALREGRVVDGAELDND